MLRPHAHHWLALSCLLALAAPASAAPAEAPRSAQSVAEAGPDWLVQGDYIGYVRIDGDPEMCGLQVIARGDGKFEARGCRGGLPGAGWDEGERPKLAGETHGAKTVLRVVEGEPAGGEVEIAGGTAVARDASEQEIGRFLRVIRKSPTLGLEPPPGAIALFDGSSTDEFRTRDGGEAPIAEDGSMRLMRGCRGLFTRREHGSCRLHLEFRLPFEPRSRGQGRSNSGCYLQSRFEVQILDSFGLEGRANECGGIYGVGRPSVNMAFPPLTWQSYDVEFTAAKYAPDGHKLANPRITVRHNGVLVHDDREIGVKDGTHLPAAPEAAGPGPKPLHLQDHGHEIHFRNVWLLEK